MKKSLVFIFLAIFALIACEKENLSTPSKSEQPEYYPQLEERNTNEPIVTIKTTSGDVTIRLFPDYAPKAVENFLSLIQKDYYDGIIFHRVINDFMIQGGDPTGTGTGGESIYGEPFENESSTSLFHFRGALAMANRGVDTNTSQFFIVQNKTMTDDLIEQMMDANYPTKVIDQYRQGGAPWLDGGYTVFGQVIKGMEIVDEIANVEVDENYKPTSNVTILDIEIIE